MSATRWGYAGILLLGILAGCASEGAFEPPNEEPINPLPAIYRVWWSEVERCSGRQGSFDDIRWFQADLLRPLLGRHEGHTIWIDRDYLQARQVVAHEELHALIGDPDHKGWQWEACVYRILPGDSDPPT